jgi:hypothetical protein
MWTCKIIVAFYGSLQGKTFVTYNWWWMAKGWLMALQTFFEWQLRVGILVQGGWRPIMANRGRCRTRNIVH